MDCVTSELKGTFFTKGILGKLPFYGHFPIISLKNSMVKNVGAT